MDANSLHIPIALPRLRPEMSRTERVEEIVRFYIEQYPEEWKAFCGYADDLRAAQGANDWAEVPGSEVIERKLGEKPATLHALLQNFLSKDDWVWLNPDGLNNKSMKGPNWFFKRFPQMRITKEI